MFILASILLAVGYCASSLDGHGFKLTCYKNVPGIQVARATWDPRIRLTLLKTLPSFSDECVVKLLDCVFPGHNMESIRMGLTSFNAADLESVVISLDEHKAFDVMRFAIENSEKLTRLRDNIFNQLFFGSSKPQPEALNQLVQQGLEEIDAVLQTIDPSLNEHKESFASIIHSFLLPEINVSIDGYKTDCKVVCGTLSVDGLANHLDLVNRVRSTFFLWSACKLIERSSK